MDHPAIAEAELLAQQPYNASDKKQVNNARKKVARERRDELDYVKAIMSTKQGRKWMYDMIVACKVFHNPVVQGDPYATYHNIGGQNLGKKLIQDINDAAPEEYVAMMREAKV